MHGRATASLVLLTLALGALAGPHPCRAAQAIAEVRKGEPAASCHGAAASHRAAGVQQVTGRDDGKGDVPGTSRVLCEKACHAPALAQAAPAPAGVRLAERLAPPPAPAVHSPFVSSIDHIPLA